MTSRPPPFGIAFGWGDCFRLGKFADNKQRPLLVKMNRVRGVSMILSKGAELALLSPVKIRQDLSPSERKIRALLLKSIRLSANSLIVDGVQYGGVVNGEFLKCSGVSNSVTSHEQCDDSLDSHHSQSPPFANNDRPTSLVLPPQHHCAISAEPVSVSVPTPATTLNAADSA